ncbi:MAG: lytic transglycosylase domain-containing protein [Pseudomonadota bacterium]
MTRAAFPLLLLIPALLAAAPAAHAQTAEQGQLCRAGIRAAEASAGIPAHLLMAIGRAESGRADPATGVFHPWPWTINAEGRGSFFPDRAAAIAAVRQLQSQGVRSIDIGCMQINLRHHPNAFTSLEEAFDPVANTRYAARFLSELRTELGDWNRASAAYHSRTPENGSRYQARVAELWAQESRSPAPVGPAPALAAAPRPPSAAPGVAGAALLGNGSDRAQVIAAAPGTQGRGLDAYRGAPIPLASRAPVGGMFLARRM